MNPKGIISRCIDWNIYTIVYKFGFGSCDSKTKALIKKYYTYIDKILLESVQNSLKERPVGEYFYW